ncbi:MAG: YggT family protein [Candidatus Nitrotoga sp.]
MLNDALQFLLDVLIQPFAAILLLRFHMQWLRAPMRNPLGELVMALTNFIVLRTRRLIPPLMGLDSATLLLAFVIEVLYLYALPGLSLFSGGSFPIAGVLVLALIKLLKISIYLLMAALIMQAILSWLNPHSSMMPLLTSITWRFVRPLKRRIPPVGNVDISSFALIIICQLILIVPVAALENFVLRMF